MENECELKINIVPLSSALGKDELVGLSKLHRFHIFDLDSVKNEFQIRLGFFHAGKAFEENRNISKEMSLEVMARLAATRQISEAISKVGIRNPSRLIVAYIVEKPGVDEKMIRDILKAEKISWKQKNADEEIRKMVETEIGE